MVAVTQLAITIGAITSGLIYDGAGHLATFIASGVMLVVAALLTMRAGRS